MRKHVVVRSALAGMDKCKVIHDVCDVREQLGDPRAGLPVLFESVRTFHQRPRKALPDADLAFSFERRSMVFLERRFVIEGIHVAYAAAHKQRDHRFGAGFEMRRLRQIGRTRKAFSTGAGGSRPRRFLSQKTVLAEQVNQRQSADSCSGFEQKVSSRNKSAVAHFAIIQSSHDFSPYSHRILPVTASNAFTAFGHFRDRKLVHRRGAENAEAPQREEGKREIEEKGREEEEKPLSSRTLSLSSALPQRSLRLCGEAISYSQTLGCKVINLFLNKS